MSNTFFPENSASFRRALVDILRTHLPLIAAPEAGDRTAALREIEQLRPGLVFMDIQRPEEYGLEVTRKIKLVYEDIVIDILTSCKLSEYRQQAVHKGVDCVLARVDNSSSTHILAQAEQPSARKSYH